MYRTQESIDIREKQAAYRSPRTWDTETDMTSAKNRWYLGKNWENPLHFGAKKGIIYRIENYDRKDTPMNQLNKLTGFAGVRGPVLTIVMDGVGLAPETEGNAVFQAYTPTLDRIMKEYPTVRLKAHGTAVGLPSDDDMGNSEVGHNALGAGQVFAQGAKLVTQSIESGKMFGHGNATSYHYNINIVGGSVQKNIAHKSAYNVAFHAQFIGTGRQGFEQRIF